MEIRGQGPLGSCWSNLNTQAKHPWLILTCLSLSSSVSKYLNLRFFSLRLFRGCLTVSAFLKISSTMLSSFTITSCPLSTPFLMSFPLSDALLLERPVSSHNVKVQMPTSMCCLHHFKKCYSVVLCINNNHIAFVAIILCSVNLKLLLNVREQS